MAKANVPAPRVTSAAETERLGEWTCTDEINYSDSDWTMSIFLGGLIAFGSAWIYVPLGIGGWLVRSSHPVIGWTMFAIAITMAVFAALFMYVSVQAGLEVRRRGKLLLHEFADGLVIERDRGRAMAARYVDITAELFQFENSSDNHPTPWTEWVVLLAFPDGSSATVQGTSESQVLQRRLAQRCGAPLTRNVLTVGEIAELRDKNQWE
ncbi:hypothetical protein ACFXK0_01315 [Nocardia sp. NPDC059177]|uniref:hypothetical protein n=1 Tax=Nocardia sp. NPDC059177 TaxID=3346759 RepID=UPI00368127C5